MELYALAWCMLFADDIILVGKIFKKVGNRLDE